MIGDYDIDGVNATYILLEGLERLGAEVDSDIPSRIRDGYGLNIELVERAYREGVDTILDLRQRHCRGGGDRLWEAAWHDHDRHRPPRGALMWRRMGRRCISLPPGDAVIDPKRADCGYPFQRFMRRGGGL